jgi:hypothetical protein
MIKYWNLCLINCLDKYLGGVIFRLFLMNSLLNYRQGYANNQYFLLNYSTFKNWELKRNKNKEDKIFLLKERINVLFGEIPSKKGSTNKTMILWENLSSANWLNKIRCREKVRLIENIAWNKPIMKIRWEIGLKLSRQNKR